MMSLYQELHVLFHQLPRFAFPYDGKEKNGIYLFFESGERFKGMDRIVRVGSHTGNNRLLQRLQQHYYPNHRSSIFRTHIGRCFLIKDGREEYIPLWNCDLITKEKREKHHPFIDWPLEQRLEEQITEHLKQQISFVIIPALEDTTLRKQLEMGLIATLAQAPERTASKRWLGYQQPSEKIKESKLWNVNHLKAMPLSEAEVGLLANKVKEAIK